MSIVNNKNRIKNTDHEENCDSFYIHVILFPSKKITIQKLSFIFWSHVMIPKLINNAFFLPHPMYVESNRKPVIEGT